MGFSLLNIQNPTLYYPGGSEIEKNGPKSGFGGLSQGPRAPKDRSKSPSGGQIGPNTLTGLFL